MTKQTSILKQAASFRRYRTWITGMTTFRGRIAAFVGCALVTAGLAVHGATVMITGDLLNIGGVNYLSGTNGGGFLTYNTIGGGLFNTNLAGNSSVIAGGGQNLVQNQGYAAVISGGLWNSIQGTQYCVIAGGQNNSVAVIPGLPAGQSSADRAVIGGGGYNTNSAENSVIAGGVRCLVGPAANSPLKKSEGCRFRQNGRMAPRIAKRWFRLGQLTGGGLGSAFRDSELPPLGQLTAGVGTPHNARRLWITAR